MHINLETADKYTIQAYSDNDIKIDSTTYQNSIIVNHYEIITPWSIHSIDELHEGSLLPLLKHQPKIIIIGHHKQQFASFAVMQTLAKQGIGLECMSIGAACRTFNVLLSEQREVVLGIIL